MAIDKNQIKPILEGQTGQEVADNIKANFDMLADEINNGGGGSVNVDDTFIEDSGNAIANSAVTKKFGEVDTALNKLLGDKVCLSLSASPSLIFVGEAKSITVRATLTEANEVISISNGSQSFSSDGKVNSFTHNFSVTGRLGVIERYTATATSYGRQLTATANVEGVNPVYFGAAVDFNDVVRIENRQTARKTLYNYDYTTEVPSGSRAVFAVPQEISLNTKDVKDKSSGFGFPIELAANKGGYNYYQSGVFTETKTVTLTIKKS